MEDNIRQNSITRDRAYIAIDLKSYYASVECADRGLNPLTTNLVVADAGRTNKTICLAVSPSLKSYGISGRARLFEVEQEVKKINAMRLNRVPKGGFTGESSDSIELASDPSLKLAYITAPPRMGRYLEYSTEIYSIYLKYVSPDDIIVYSIDEVFMDVTDYLKSYGMTARELAMKMILDVINFTGITATAGIGTNLYLAKIAMDIYAKHIEPDENGVRLAELDEMTYRKELWAHRPITDFWRVGKGTAKRLERYGMYTMGDVARCSIGGPGEFHNEELLYKQFGVNAELLIDHAWGYEPVTMKEIKAYRPETNCLSSGQVLNKPYSFEKAKLIAKEMAEQLSLDLAGKHLNTKQLTLTVNYDIVNMEDPEILKKYKGEIVKDYYGRLVPKHAHGTANLNESTSSTKEIMEAVSGLYDRITNRYLYVRRLTITANDVIPDEKLETDECQLDMFSMTASEEERKLKQKRQADEKRVQETLLEIKKKFGKNAVFRGMDLEEDATTMLRNKQIGGHRE